MSTATPGWYKNGDVMRYWNGIEWTDETRPYIPDATAVSEPQGIGLAIGGYIFAVVIPIVGFIMGIVAANKPVANPNKKHGALIIVISILAAVGWVMLIRHQQDVAAQNAYCATNGC